MSEHVEAQQAAAEGLGALGLNATLMVHFPSKIKAPEGILLTTYDQRSRRPRLMRSPLLELLRVLCERLQQCNRQPYLSMSAMPIQAQWK